jgi:AraC-like DNA-binding protein
METSGSREWSRFFRFDECHSTGALHAHFVTHRYPRHVHEYFVVGLVESGVQSYLYRGTRHVTPAGNIFLVNPDEPHTGEAAAPEGYVYRTVYPSVELLAQVAGDVGTHAKIPFFKAAIIDDPLLARRLTRFHASLAKQAPNIERESLLFEALTCLITRHADPTVLPKPIGRERRAVRIARDHMEAAFGDDISLSVLADLVSLSPYYFARAFQNEIGLPPHAYLEGVRLTKARQFLDRGMDLATTALAVGYSDQSHFTRRFKRFLGITPGQYIRESKIRQDLRHGT